MQYNTHHAMLIDQLNAFSIINLKLNKTELIHDNYNQA